MFTGRLKTEIPKALASRLVLILVFVDTSICVEFWGEGRDSHKRISTKT